MLKLDSINYLGTCKRGHDDEPIPGLVIASFELGEASIETYVEFLESLRNFVARYNREIQEEFEEND